MFQNFSSTFLKGRDVQVLHSNFCLEVLICRTAVYLPLNIKSQMALSDWAPKIAHILNFTRRFKT